MEAELKDYAVYKLDSESEEFEELHTEGKLLTNFLNSDSVLIFLDQLSKVLWLWHGANTTPRLKFIAARKSPNLRDRVAIDYKISAIDENREPERFKLLVGLK
ncbi:MAG: hypothetical protein GF311_27140 [Candidatus Lokiarchaeota archaeon]|jgi:hypothetical protein|nr:hypothetical protein [Candidatus Lokiarchaeota archaeon]